MDIVNNLKKYICENNILLNEPMSKHTSFKVGGPADIFVKVNNIDALRYVLKISKENDIPLFILGNGSNILVRDKGIRGIVCKIDIEEFDIVNDGEDVFVKLRKRKQSDCYF